MTLFLLAAGLASAQTVPLEAERRYHESLAAYAKGDYRTALEGFMDVLLQDPDYPGARDRLNATAKKIRLEKERQVDEERKRLMADIESAASAAAKPKKVYVKSEPAEETWQKLFGDALRLARKPASLPSAMASYERALRAYPVTADGSHEFLAARTRLQKALYLAFPKAAAEAPWKSRNPGAFNTGEFVLGLFTEKHYAARWKTAEDDLFVFSQKEQRDENSDRASRVAELENRLGEGLKLAFEARERYSGGKIVEAASLWQKLQEVDPSNKEAAFYLDKIASEGAPPPEAPKTAAQPRPAPKAALDEGGRSAEGEADLAQQYYLEGVREYSAGRLDEAIHHWKACLELDPGHSRAKKALERAKQEKG